MPETSACVRVQAFEIYLKFKAFPDALRVALRANDRELQQRAFAACDDFLVKQQLCHILARQVWHAQSSVWLAADTSSKPLQMQHVLSVPGSPGACVQRVRMLARGPSNQQLMSGNA